MIPFTGFLIWLGLILFPGFALGETFQPWKQEDSLSVRFAYVFLLGLAFDVVMLAWHPAHFPGGLAWEDFDLIVAVSIGLLIGNHKFTFLKKPRKSDFALLILAGLMGMAVLIHFYNFPIFPEFPSGDLRTHIFITETISYSMPGLTTSLLYGGIHLLLASLFLFQSGDHLILIQEGMGILAVLSLLAVYLSAARMFSEKVALIVSGIYALGGFVWFGFVFNVGLYPNFLALIAGGFLVVAFIDSLKGTWISVGVFVLALAFSFFTHYSIITLFPALVVVGLYEAVKNQRSLKFGLVVKNITVVLLLVIPIVAGVILFPDLVSALRSTLLGGSSPVLGSGSYTFLADLFSPIPVISFIFEETTSDIIAITLILLAILGAIKSRKNPFGLIMLIWLATLILVSPFNNVAWRYSLIALSPLTYLAGKGLTSLTESKSATNFLTGLVQSRPTMKNLRKAEVALAIVLLSFVFMGGWTVHAFVITDQLTDQKQINQALNWVSTNGTGSIITPTDWRFEFSTLYYPHSATLFSCSLVADPNIAFYAAVQQRASYIAVTRQMACSNYPCFQQDVISLSIRNSTLGHSIIINGYEFNKNNGSMSIFADNQNIGAMSILNGNGTEVVGFKDYGNHSMHLQYQNYVSNVERFTLGSSADPVSIPVPLDACFPFYSWSSYSLHGASLVFSSKDVKIFCIVRVCTK